MAITPTHLKHDAFAVKVLEQDLRTIEVNGYLYAWGKEKPDPVLYRTYGPKWKYLYQARRINTQDNAGGGALMTRIQMNPGQVGELVRLYALNTASAGSALAGYVYDEDVALTGRLGVIGAAASTSFYLPSIGSSSGTSSNLQETLGMKLGPGEYLAITATAALQTEYLTVGVVMLLSSDDVPLWDTTGSGGTPNLAASTISEANTMVPVLLP